MDPAPPRLADLNVAALVRARLAEARAAGRDFDDAWHDAMDALALEAPDTPERATAQRREAESWRAAIAWARPHFRRAYYREPVEGAEGAASALEDLAA